MVAVVAVVAVMVVVGRCCSQGRHIWDLRHHPTPSNAPVRIDYCMAPRVLPGSDAVINSERTSAQN